MRTDPDLPFSEDNAYQARTLNERGQPGRPYSLKEFQRASRSGSLTDAS